MRVYYIKDRSIIYILIAIFCLILIFFGVKIISNLKYDQSSQKTLDVVEVFNENSQKAEDVDKDDNIDKDDVNDSGFLVKILSNSNVFIKSIYDEKYNNKNILTKIKEVLTKDIKIEQKLLKSQLPAIISTADLDEIELGNNGNYVNRGSIAKDNSKEDLEIESDYSPLGDVSFIDGEDDEVIPTSSKGISKEEALEAIKGIEKPKNFDIASNNSPYVMIYHTHATEAYLPKAKVDYRTKDKEYNVIAVGNIMDEELKKRGHSVSHIETLHDYPSYNESYSRSLATIKEETNKNKNLKVLIDIHRDGVTPNTSYYDKIKKQSVIEIDGEKVGTFRFVIGNDTPNKNQILLFSNYIKDISDMIYPGLCLEPIIKPYGKYNQYLSDYTLLMEVGSNINNIEDTKRTAKYVAEILDVALKGIIN